MANNNSERSLVRKLTEVMAEVERIPKGGHNDHFNYDFVREQDMLSAVRPLFAKKQLLMTMSADSAALRAWGDKGTVMLIPYLVTIYDGESGESIEFTVIGSGQDTQDKGPYKALTGAVKYALMKLLLVDTGDDPENEHRPVASVSAQPQPQTQQDASTLRYVATVTVRVDTNEPPKWTLYNLAMTDGLRVSTFSRTDAETAKFAKENELPVSVQYTSSEKGNNLDEIKLVVGE